MTAMWTRTFHPSNERRWLLYLASLTLIFMFTPAARALVILLPIAVLYLAFRLMRRDKGAFVELVCWLYFLSPFVRRVVDYNSGDIESVLLALPLLALLAPLYLLLSQWTRAMDRQSAPFGYALLALAYGSILAVLAYQVKTLIPILPLWLLPLVFGTYVFLNRADINQIFDGFERGMVGGTLFSGAYGLLQYLIVPAWDELWLVNTDSNTFGKPEPYEIRVFSTLNAPQILGAFILVGIIVAFRSKHRLRWPTVFFGFVSLALSSVRSAWVAFAVSVVYLILRSSAKERARALMFVGGCTLLFSCAAVIPEAQETLQLRVNSLFDIQNDYSANDRSEQFADLFRRILISPFGQGIGVDDNDSQHDSSVINMLLCLGGFGSIIFLYGFGRIGGGIFLARGLDHKPRLLTVQIFLLALLIEFPVNNVISGPAAFLTWSSLGLGFAFVVREQEESTMNALLPAEAALTHV